MEWEVEYTDDSKLGGTAFDPRRAAILLIGGNKTRNPKWYDEYMPIADRLFDEH